jgi:DNA-binding MarR family transcriptional regulator
MEPDPRMYQLVQHLFVCELELEQLMNRELAKDGLTVKQFHLLWVVGNNPNPPSLKELADLMATSHQNVKQIAQLLSRKGFVRLERDDGDRRILRVHLTEANEFYWKRRAPDHDRAIRKIFGDITEEELEHLVAKLGKLRESFENQLEFEENNKRK